MLTDEEVKKIRETLEHAKRPYYLFDDDPDGLAAFLLLYRKYREGRGVPLKSKPEVTRKHIDWVKRYGPDLVVILDIGLVDQEFIDGVGVPVLWIDHHEPQDCERVHYFNPEKSGQPNSPTCAMCYQVVRQDVWIATVGAFNDHYYPDYAGEFRKLFPDLLPERLTTIAKIRFESPVGVLARVLGNNLKGTTEGTRKGISALIKVQDPREILERSTPVGKLLWKRYMVVQEEYLRLRDQADAITLGGDIWVFIYRPGKYSVTTDLADELNYRIKSDIIILGREKDGEYRCSLRSKPGIPLRTLLKKALKGIQGYGGGHMHSCGAAIKVADFNRFLATMQDELEKYKSGSTTEKPKHL